MYVGRKAATPALLLLGTLLGAYDTGDGTRPATVAGTTLAMEGVGRCVGECLGVELVEASTTGRAALVAVGSPVP